MNYSKRKFFYHLYKRLTLGKVEKKLSLLNLKESGYTDLINPVFVLSTGRCRTHWITNLLSDQKKVFVEHNPEISFLEEGKAIYESLLRQKERTPLLKQLVFTARDNIWLDCAKRGLRYIETNNRITFAAPILRNELKDSKFLHLTRDPIDFIISGRNRDWYKGNSHDLGRISMMDKKEWEKLSLNQKIGWLWKETNKFILESTKGLPSDRYMCIASEDLNEHSLKEVMKFLELQPNTINKSKLGTITNSQKDSIKLNRENIIEELEGASFYEEFKKTANQFGYMV